MEKRVRIGHSAARPSPVKLGAGVPVPGLVSFSLEAYPLVRRVLLASWVLARVFSTSNCMDSSRPIRRRLYGLVHGASPPLPLK